MSSGFNIATVRPLGNRVLIRRDKSTGTYGSGVILRPDTYNDQRQTGTVLAVGPGVLNPRDGTYTPLEVRVGDRVWFTPWHNETVEGDANASKQEEEYTLVPGNMLAAVIPPE